MYSKILLSMKTDWQKAIEIIKNNGLVILPTDTLYGLVASTKAKKAIDKIYKIKERDENKALIVLISSFKDLNKFGIKINKKEIEFLNKIWPGEVSVLLSCNDLKFKYIHRGTNEIAFRMIGDKNKDLFNLLEKVDPVVAPSANKEGFVPAETIKEAKSYFGGDVDLYINGGRRVGEPSTLIRLKNEQIEVLRQGKVKIKTLKI